MSDTEPRFTEGPQDGMAEFEHELTFGHPLTRRHFLALTSGAAVGLAAFSFPGADLLAASSAPSPLETLSVTLKINGKTHVLQLDPRVTLLDALRNRLNLCGTKKGCDHGQCGACTVLVNQRRANACLLLAATCEGDEITTIEGLAREGELHPMQAAFLKHDGFQCGYCTPGQICSAVACVVEGHARSEDDIREYMSGNICRCGAYANIRAAILEARDATAQIARS